MNQLTVRGFDDELSASIHRLAEREGISLNRAALLLLRKGAGLPDARNGAASIGDALDQFIGSMSAEEADDLLAALQH